MFTSFFASKRYLFWAWPGVVLIVSGIAGQVQIDVALNSGIGELFSPGSNQLSNFERDIADRWKIKSFICDSIEDYMTKLG